MNQESKNGTTPSLRKSLNQASLAIYLVGVLSLLLGLLALKLGSKVENSTALAIGFLGFGGLHLILGALVQRRSKPALVTAMVFMALNLVAGIYNISTTGKPTGLFVPLIFFSQTWPAFQALQELEKPSKA
jgi:uncharacterized membrane protein HdeD (DUF308 family)